MSFRLNFISSILLAGAVLSVNAIAADNKDDPNNIMQAKIEAFVDPSSLTKIQTDADSQISLSNLRSITGKNSLEWNWKSGSSLIFHENYYVPSDQEARKAAGRPATPLFSFFIYNEKPINDYLTVDLGQGVNRYNTGDATFKVKLNFKGWRAVGVSVNDDINYRPIAGMGSLGNTSNESNSSGQFVVMGGIGKHIDSIRFLAPSSVKSGRFFIDNLMFSVDDARFQWSDYYVKTRITEPEIKFYTDYKLPDVPSTILVKNIQEIRQRFTDLLLNTPQAKLQEITSLKELEHLFEQFEIKKDKNGVFSGRHIITLQQRDRYQPDYLTKQDRELYDQYILLGDYATVMYNLSRIYARSNDPILKKKIADRYILMTEYLLDQGFEKGSSLITTHHWGYNSRWWYLSAFLMQDVLQKAHLKQAVYDALLWYSREFRSSFDMKLTPESSDLDYFNTLSLQHLALLFLNPDQSNQIKLINSYTKYIEGALAQTPPGGFDGLRPDGTAWRHWGHYPGYAFPAFTNASKLFYLFKGTVFQLNQASYDNLKKAMLAGWIYSNPYTGIALGGRHPFSPESILPLANAFYYLAISKNGGIDKELAAIYLALAGKKGIHSKAFLTQGIQPEKLPQGFWSFNGGAFGIHRFNDKMVTLKGYNSNVWSSEIYLANNRYGRYQSNGSAQILLHKAPELQGFIQDGWDWNRLPGATTIHLPLEKLDSPNKTTLMLRGETPYNGTSELLQQYGMLAFNLFSPSRYPAVMDPKFVAKKSILTGGDHLIMIGTDINSSQQNKNVETTLFQLATSSSGDSVIDGKKLAKLGEKVQLKTGDWLIDGDGNGYLLTQVKLGYATKQHQISANGDTRAKTEGNFSVAWIDHSAQPENASYQYMVFLDATPAKMKQLATEVKAGKLPYQFIQQGQVHIIKDKLTDVTGYAFYQAGSIKDKFIKSVNIPSIVMLKNQGNELDISAVTTDLGLGSSGKKQPKSIDVVVTLNGKWQVVKPNPKVKLTLAGNNTLLTFSSYFGIPQEVKLHQL